MCRSEKGDSNSSAPQRLFVLLKLVEDHETATEEVKSGHPHLLGISSDLKQWCVAVQTAVTLLVHTAHHTTWLTGCRMLVLDVATTVNKYNPSTPQFMLT